MTQTETKQIPSSDELRAALVARCQQFCDLTGTTKSELGRAAVGDVALIGDIEAGRNITFNMLDRIRAYLDGNWPTSKAAAKPKRRGRP